MNGRFIACEGIDGTGKTYTINHALEALEREQYVYVKGLKSDTAVGKLARRFPSTLTFLMELSYLTDTIIKPSLKKGKTVVQDRYDISVKSYPTASRWYNRILTRVFKRFLLEPDVLVYFTASPEERKKRLQQTRENRYHACLLENPSLADMVEKNYERFFENFGGDKTRIDTTNGKGIDDLIEILKKE